MTDKRIFLIVNPLSGKRRGMVVLEQLKPVFAAADAEMDVQVTEQAGHARQIAKEFDLAEYDGLCLIGGDGTVHEAVSGLFEQGEPASIPLGIIPCGTGNDVAKQLGIDSPQSAVIQQAANRMHVQKGLLAWLLAAMQ